MRVFFCPSVDQASALLERLEYPAVKLPNRDLVLGTRTALRAHLLAFLCWPRGPGIQQNAVPLALGGGDGLSITEF